VKLTVEQLSKWLANQPNDAEVVFTAPALLGDGMPLVVSESWASDFHYHIELEPGP
jgi:hypothetical protein